MLFSTGTFDRVSPNDSSLDLPLRLVSSPDRGRTIGQFLLIVPALLMLLAPALLATYVLMHQDAATNAPSDPFATAALILLPVLWVGLVVFAAFAVIPRLRRQRVVTLTTDYVSALERGLFGTEAWRLPTASYRGIAHHVRATAGVVSHEVILVHPDPKRSVLLYTAPVVTQGSLDSYCARLRLPLVPAREVYRLPRIQVALRLGARQDPRSAMFGAADALEGHA